MNKKIVVSTIVLCFNLSNINISWAVQAVETSPIIVQPYNDLRDIDQQMIEQDQINRDQELAIRGLIDDDQRLAETAMARQQDDTLDKIDQTLAKYRDFLLGRDRQSIYINGQRINKYHDLVVLTENVDDMKDAQHFVKLKSNVINEKYTLLTELKNELLALNEKLKGQAIQEIPVKIEPGQNDRIQMLTQRLAEMDQKIAHYDQILADKDRQIAQLNNTVQQQNDSIHWLNQVLAVAKNKAEYYQLTSKENRIALAQVQKQVQQIRDDFTQRIKVYSQFENAIVSLKAQVSGFGTQLAQKQEQVNLLKSELENKINEANNDDRIQLARKLISLQEEQTALLEEKSRLREAQDALSDQHVQELENKMKGMVADHQIQIADLRGHVEEFKNELYQKDQQVGQLTSALNEKTIQEKNQSSLQSQIRDLQIQLQAREDRISAMNRAVQAHHEAEAEVGILKQQLADQQNNMDLLKQELETKITQSKAYNQQLKQALLAKNNQSQMDEQIADLSARLQNKEAQVIQLKKDLRDIQTNDLNQSMVQQKTSDGQAREILTLKSELVSTQQQLRAVPGRDEMVTKLKANADEYRKEFLAQSAQFQSLKEQLQNAYDEIDRRNEDLKYKKLELIRFKEQTAAKEGDLLNQVKDLTRKLEIAGKRLRGEKVETPIEIPSSEEALRKKLAEALNKIDEQGRIINVLAQKLQDVGQSVNLTKIKTQ